MRLFYWDFLEDLEVAVQCLKEGHVLAGETDTVIGLFAECSNEGIKKLDLIKGRGNKPYIFLVSDLQRAKKIVDSTCHDLLGTVAEVVWPGPVTVIIKASNQYLYATGQDGTIAIRIPDNHRLRLLLENFDALFSTSANKHQEPVPQSVSEINPELLKHIGGIIAFKEEQGKREPSTIIRVTHDTIEVVRGKLSSELIKKLGQRFTNIVGS